MIVKIIKKIKENYDNKINLTISMHKYLLLKEALTKNCIYPIDKKHWEECISVYEINLKKGNKKTTPSFFKMMKEEYNEYLELLNEKEKEKEKDLSLKK